MKNKIESEQLSQYINDIRFIPVNLLAQQYKLDVDLDENGPHNTFLNHIRTEYRCKADWLRYYLLNDTSFLKELTFTFKVQYKIFAEKTLAFFRLAQEIYPRVIEVQLTYNSPAHWMFQCELDLCSIILKNSGYLSEPNVVGKSQQYKNAVEEIKILENVSLLEPIYSPTFISHSPIAALHICAIALAKEDITFKKYWSDYLRANARVLRTLKNNKEFQLCYLDGNKVKYFSSGKRKSHKQKGFRK